MFEGKVYDSVDICIDRSTTRRYCQLG